MLFAQSAPSRATAAQPIPNAATLLRQVVAHQRQMDSLRENYTYRELQVTRKLDSHGNIQSTQSSEFRVFFVHTHEIDELIQKNGHSLTPGRQRKQQKLVQKAIAQAQSTPPGQSANGHTITVSQLLAIMTLSNPRRVTLDGRPTLVFNFTGDRHAHAHDKTEKTLRDIAGTIWIDEQDHEVRRLTAHFDANFHEGWGLIAVDKGSTFTFTQRLMHGELWLPSGAQIHLVAHALAFIGYRADIMVTDSDYQVFHATAAPTGSAQILSPSHP
jgi:hypothetical protein